MRKHFWWIGSVLLLVTVSFISWTPAKATKNIENIKTTLTAKQVFEQYVNTVYQTAGLQEAGLDAAVFHKAITGYLNIKASNKVKNANVLTVVDFTKSSRVKRMWIIDMVNQTLLLNTLVAHGQGSGDDMATNFSDINQSHQSSLGFYLADDVYVGKHGRSLRLDGLDEGFNTSARARGIVVHAADYVSEGTINTLGRLGRSHGCPAVSPAVVTQVINTLKGKTVFFINGNNTQYSSKYLDENILPDFAAPDSTLMAMN
ncbi:murein L,D-transpeptidase catalytic domain family protein [Mucilaginibacter antarcticus]|uniref:Murein L,D-transpeptidase catalytic domain family protein n=1 Tax=Mucilaginibacter antarcticus TaxID=1855725 RepID=A0ABW5XPL9_9SPHI